MHKDENDDCKAITFIISCYASKQVVRSCDACVALVLLVFDVFFLLFTRLQLRNYEYVVVVGSGWVVSS